MRRFKFEKLVRDKVPERHAQENVISEVRLLEGPLYREALLDKLLEEASETREATTPAAAAAELAEILEVAMAIAQHHNLSWEAVESERLKKQEERGGFTQGIYIEHIDVPEDNQRILTYVLADPAKYPEISR